MSVTAIPFSVRIFLTSCLLNCNKPQRIISAAICGKTATWSEWRDSNARPLAPKASALPLGYTRIFFCFFCGFMACFSLFFLSVVGHVVRVKSNGLARAGFSGASGAFCLSTRTVWISVGAPKCGALPTGLPPDIVRRNSLHCVSALRRKLHIRSFLLPPRIGPAKLGSNSEKREKKLAALRFRLTAKRPRSSELAYYTSSAGGTQGNFLPAGGACVFSLMFLYNCGILSKGV